MPLSYRRLQTDTGQAAVQANLKAEEDITSIYRWTSGIVFTLIGFPLCFFGLLWWKANSWIMGCMCGWFFGAAIQKMFTGEGDEVVQWVMLVVIVGLTITFMLVFYFFPKLASALLGACLGILVTNILFAVVLACNGDKGWAWWISLVALLGSIALGSTMGCCWSEPMNVVSTSMVGGWCLIAGVGTLCGQFPKRYVVMDAADEWTWFLWFAGAITCMVVGLIVQCMHKNQRQHDADPADEVTAEKYV